MVAVARTVHIEAPPERVWEVLVEVEGWLRFAPHFKSIERKDEGSFALGSKVKVTPRWSTGSIWEVTEFEEGRSFTWEADAHPGVHVVADHVVEPDGDGTRATLSLTSSRPLAALLAPVLVIIFRRPLRQVAEGVKGLCEGGDA